ncbi:hypothetical protein IKW75_03055 [Candidatus Saccharibacteria bacterium]|nr:hypothetical protein [Candidatus Saccharibacteria bacterium]
MFKQTNNLQEAIDEAATKDQFGVPPVPPAEGEGVPAAPFSTPETPAAPEASLSAEQILADSLTTSTNEPTPAIPEVPEAPEIPAPIEAAPETTIPEATTPEVPSDLASIRESVIRDLLPLLDKTDSTPEEKFDIYKDALKTMHDAKTIEGAYKTATQITDDTKKADALIGLMKTIDNA